MMRLYRAPFSTNVERVTLALAHKGLRARPVWISYDDRSAVERAGGHPLVPVLEFDGVVVVFDSMQIVRMLEERSGRPRCIPPTRRGRAWLIHFVDWSTTCGRSRRTAIEAEIATEAPDVARIDELAASIASALAGFEAMLEGRAFLLGRQFSAADCTAYPFLKYALWRDPADDELFHRVLDSYQQLGDDHLRLRAWIERVGERPQV